MRKWIAVLAFVPVAAWGQASQCTSPEANRTFGGMADAVLGARRDGNSREAVVRRVESITEPGGQRQVWMALVDYAFEYGDDAQHREAVVRAISSCMGHFTRR